MKYFLAILGLVAFMFGMVVLTPRPKIADNGKGVNIETVVQLRSSSSTCSGFIVARGVVATAGHCIHATDTRQLIVFSDGTSRPYLVFSYTNDGVCVHDWALLLVDTGKRGWEDLKYTEPDGPTLYTVGHVGASRNQLAFAGMLLAVDAENVYMGSGARHGQSGSPIADHSGRVVAVLVCGDYDAGESIGVRVSEFESTLRLAVAGQ